MGVGPVRVRRDSSAGMAWIAGEERKTTEGCGPGGLSPHWASGSCDDPAGPSVPWLSQAMVLRRHPCRGAAISLSKLLFPGPEWQSPQAAVDGLDGLRYKGQGYGVYDAHPRDVPHVQYDRPDGVQRGTHGVYHLIDNHGDDTGRGEQGRNGICTSRSPRTAGWPGVLALLRGLSECGIGVPALRGSLS